MFKSNCRLGCDKVAPRDVADRAHKFQDMNFIPKYDQCQSGAISLCAYLEWQGHEGLACFAVRILQWFYIFLNILRTGDYFLKFFFLNCRARNGEHLHVSKVKKY